MTMAVQLSIAVRNARLDQIESTIGASAVMRIFTGSPPVNCSASDSGTVLATVNLPSDWMAAASGGSKVKAGTWEDLLADNDGTAGHFRVYNNGVSICHMQGTVATAAADMIVDSTVFTVNQPFRVIAFTLTDGNA